VRPTPSSPEKSLALGKVRQKDTAAEREVASVLRSLGLSYRKNVRSLPGSPDFANRRGRWAVFVHGCYWHHHTGCDRATVPKANRAFWIEKFTRNRQRDAQSIRALRRMEFKVVLVWECDLKDARTRLQRSLNRVL
jgi:DNA mismatch endonuclease (patch repair protein)